MRSSKYRDRIKLVDRQRPRKGVRLGRRKRDLNARFARALTHYFGAHAADPIVMLARTLRGGW